MTEWLKQLGFKETREDYFEFIEIINKSKGVAPELRGRHITYSFRLVRRWLFWFQITDFQTYNHQTHIRKLYEDCRFTKDNLNKLLQNKVLPVQEEWILSCKLLREW